MSKNKPYRTLSEKEIQDYLKGKTTGKNAHKLERHLLNDAFDMDAVEGFELYESDNITSDIELLKRKLGKKTQNWYKVAATVALLITSFAAIWITVDFADTNESGVTMIERWPESEDSGPDPAQSFAPPEIPEVSEPDPIQPVPEEEPSLTQSPVERVEEGTSTAAYEEMDPVESIDVFSADQEVPVLADEEVDFQPANAMAIATEDAPESEGSADVSFHKKMAGSGAVSRSMSSNDPTNLSRVRGQVTDDFGDPLSGVSVVVKGSSTGVITDMNGHYEFNMLSEDATLQFSLIGFEMAEILVNGRTVIDAELEADVSTLSEVVVTANDEIGITEIGYEKAKPVMGVNAYRDYLKENLNYPDTAKVKGITGNVVLKVNVSALGAIGAIEVKRSLGHGCDEEAIRLIRQGPDWEAAIRDGKAVESTVRVRVNFELD